MTEQIIVGTFCGVVNSRILVATCPLKKGGCMWQHRQSKVCCYTSDELSPQDFAARVGAPPPDEAQVEYVKHRLAATIKDSQAELRK